MLKEKIFWAFFLGIAVAALEELELGQISSTVAKNVALEFDTLTPKQHPPSVDDIADVFLSEIRMWDLDYLQLPDINKRISLPFSSGILHLTHGEAQGITNIYRDGHVMINYINRIITLDAPIIFSRILVNYDYTLKVVGWRPEGNIIADGTNIRIFLSLSFDLNYSRFILNKIDISEIGRIDIKFQPDGIVSLLADNFSKDITTFVKSLILETVQDFSSNALDQLIAVVNNKLAEIKPPPTDIA